MRSDQTSEYELRQQIAEDIKKKMLPVCICERCDNLQEGYLVQKAINIVLGKIV